MDRRVDLFIGILVVLFGIFVLVAASHIRPTGPVVDPIGPRGFPYMIGLLFLFGGGFVVASRLKSWRNEAGNIVETDGEADEPDVPASAFPAWVIMAASVLYALALNPVGYVLATPIYVTVALKAMRMRSWMTVIAVAVCYTILTYLLFAKFMGVNLPVGPLIHLFRSLHLAR